MSDIELESEYYYEKTDKEKDPDYEEEEEDDEDEEDDDNSEEDEEDMIRKERRRRRRVTISLENATTSNVDLLLKQVFAGFFPTVSKVTLTKKYKRIEELKPLIQKFGLDQDEFNIVFEMIMSFSLGPSMSRGLVQLLLPRDDIADDYIIRIIGSVSQRDQNLGVLAELLKWTIAVFDVISDKQRLNHLYHVFFRHLHYEELRRSLCHLLYFLTKKEHVTKYRVTRLKEMIDAERDNAELIALLLVYQTYDASINVPHNVRLADMLVFRNPLPQVKHNLTNLRILWKNDIQFKTDIIKGEIRLPTMKRVRMSKKKRLEQATEEARKELSVVDVSDVINSVDHVGLSDQLSMVLQKRSLQYALLYDPEGTAVTRLSYYIVQILFDLLIYGNKKDTGKQELGDMLRTLVRFTRFTKTQLPAVQIFLYRYLKTWNGYEYEDEILTLITYLKPASFKELSEYILKPLCRLYVASDVKWKSKLILCYTEWLKNWAALDWKQHVRLRKEASDTSIDHLTSLFGKLSFDVNYFRTIQKFVEHVDKLCVSGLLAEDDHVLMQHAGLTFFELVAQISRQDDIPDIIIPAATFVHRNFFSTTAMAVSRICGIIHQYKVAFEENDRKTIDWSSKHTQEYLEHFNTYMMDICNSLWRNLGLSQSKENEQAFSFTEKNIEHFIQLCQHKHVDSKLVLSITHSGALVSFSKRFMEIIEKDEKVNVYHDKPITANYLKQLDQKGGVSISYMEYRVEYLDYLSELGLKGIPELLYACMNSLIQLKKNPSS